MFEAYPSDGENKEEYKKYHVIKVIPDDAVEVQVEEEEKVFIIKEWYRGYNGRPYTLGKKCKSICCKVTSFTFNR